jgi:hypothetical protein
MKKEVKKPTTEDQVIDPPDNQGGNGKKYRVLRGLSYYDNKARGEVGDIVTDLPAESIAWLLEQHCIEPVEESEAN